MKPSKKKGLKKKKKKPDMKIINMVVNGKMPFERSLKFEEIEDVIEKGILDWGIVNQETSPMLIATVFLEGFNKSNKQRKATMTLWHSGSFNLAGVKKRKEINECYEKILGELKKITPKVFERRIE
jgi:TATA-box binding protein (TBP) (component of TFIID and TFIIIB)